MPIFQPGIKFCENLTESPFVAAGAGSVFFVVVSGFFVAVVVDVTVSGFFVVVVVVATVSGFVVVVVVVVVVVATVVVSAFVVVVAAVVSAFVVVVAVVVEAELFSDDVAAFPEQAEIPVITIMPLKIAASILFFIGTFLSLTARFFEMRTAVYYCVNHIVMVFTEKVNSKTGLSANFVKTITRRLQKAKNRL